MDKKALKKIGLEKIKLLTKLVELLDQTLELFIKRVDFWNSTSKNTKKESNIGSFFTSI